MDTVVVWKRVAPIGSYGNTWLPIGGTAPEELGVVAMLEDVCHVGGGLWGFKSLHYSHPHSASCLWATVKSSAPATVPGLSAGAMLATAMSTDSNPVKLEVPINSQL